MKLSAFHKAKSDQVFLVKHDTPISDPDVVYVSVIYEKNKWKALKWNNALFTTSPIVSIGGTGYDLKSAIRDDLIKPDYDLYPSTYSQGFTTRGCTRNCYFCVVPQKEGMFRRVQHPMDFHDDRFDTINIMDNNWLVDPNWFEICADWIIKKGLKLIENGFDIRLINRRNAAIIRQFKKPKDALFHFAFDNLKDSYMVVNGLKLLEEAGFNLRKEISVYVYLHTTSDKEFSDALKRVYLLKTMGANPYLMFNIDKKKTREVMDLERWVNNKRCFWKTDFENYKRTM